MIRFSNQAEVIAALAVSEHSDNDALISARDQFIMMAKLAHPEDFTEATAEFDAGIAVTIAPMAKAIDITGRILEAINQPKSQKSPWSNFVGIFGK